LLSPIRWVVALTAIPAAFAPLWGPTPVLVCAGAMVLVVMVPKGSGLGWTFNFARPVAWVVFTLLLLGPLFLVAAMMLQATTGR